MVQRVEKTWHVPTSHERPPPPLLGRQHALLLGPPVVQELHEPPPVWQLKPRGLQSNFPVVSAAISMQRVAGASRLAQCWRKQFRSASAGQ